MYFMNKFFRIFVVISMVASLWLIVVFVIFPYAQMHRWLSLAKKIDLNTLNTVDTNSSIFTNESLASLIIKLDFINTVFSKQKPEPPLMPSFEQALQVMEKSLDNYIKYPYAYYMLARAYDLKATVTGDKQLYKKAEGYYEQALKLFPERQEFIYPYAFNILQQGNKEEARRILETYYAKQPDLVENSFYLGMIYINFGQSYYSDAYEKLEQALGGGFEVIDISAFSDAYTKLFEYFYKKNDKEKVLQISQRLASVEGAQTELFSEIVRYIQINNTLPEIKIQSE